MKIAAISHSCVIDVNQQVFVELRRHPDVDLLLIAPQHWRSPLRGHIAFSALPELADCSRPLPARLAGLMHLHWYAGLGAALRDFRPDVLYVDEEPYSVVTSQALAWRERLGCKFVFWTKQNLRKRYPFPFSHMQARVLRRADHAMAVSAAAEQVLRAAGYQGSTTVLPHGIQPELYQRCHASDLRTRLGLSGPVVGFVGRLAPEKGVWDLLTAAKILVSRGVPAFTVLMIGDGPARWKLEQAAARDLPPGTFCFVGSVAHHAIADYLGVLDILVLPSRTRRGWKEQFGRVLVEAMACGVPCVGSDSGHIPELIAATGGGVVCREADPEDLADKIASLLADRDAARQMGERGRQAVVDKYAYPRIAQTLYEALRQVVEG